MKIKETDIQERYTDSLHSAKKNGKSCCGPNHSSEVGQEGIVVSLETIDPISFGCVSLGDVLQEVVRPGMTVVDLGSGPGHDLLKVARLVGPTGRAVGVDFTPAMVTEALTNADQEGLSNVEVVQADIASTTLPDNIADVVVSNCVINLASDKGTVFQEVHRILKPGGLLVNGDMIASRTLDPQVSADPALWCACVGGALTEDQYKSLMVAAGLEQVEVRRVSSDIAIYDDERHGVYSGLLRARKPLN